MSVLREVVAANGEYSRAFGEKGELALRAHPSRSVAEVFLVALSSTDYPRKLKR